MMMAGGFDTSSPYPTRDEYDIAIARWQESIWDADIRSGTLAYDNMGICRFGGANLYVSIYKIGNWMVRCFCSKPNKHIPADIQERYMAIERFCRANAKRVSALVPVIYLEQGITVGMRVLPIVKMPFLSGCPSLGEFLIDTYGERATMQQLCNAWLRMMHELEAASMAHGDLDLTNVFVERHGASITLRLIDYDNTWIPALAGRSQTEYGHSNFQHPNFLPPNPRPFNAEMDRFSALNMYISLKMLVTHPHLYEAWGADESDRLLLSDTDFRDAGLDGSRLRELRSLSGPDMHPYIDELSASLREGRMPRSLFDIVPQPNAAPSPRAGYPPGVPLPWTNGPQGVHGRGTPGGYPARAIWSNAVYNANTVFNTPPLPPGRDSLEMRPATRSFAFAQHDNAFAQHDNAFTQDDNSAWRNNPDYAQPRSWMTGSNGMATPGNSHYNASSPSQFWNPSTPTARPQFIAPLRMDAGPATPYPSTVDEDAHPLPLPSPVSNASGGRRTILIMVTISFLVLVMLAAAMLLILFFNGDIHIADIVP